MGQNRGANGVTTLIILCAVFNLINRLQRVAFFNSLVQSSFKLHKRNKCVYQFIVKKIDICCYILLKGNFYSILIDSKHTYQRLEAQLL